MYFTNIIVECRHLVKATLEQITQLNKGNKAQSKSQDAEALGNI